MNRILVTGASRGLGLEMARQYLQRGERVFAGSRSLENIGGLRQLAGQFPDKLHIVQLDVTDTQSIAAAASTIAGEVDGLEILVNNAGIHEEGESIKEFQPEAALKYLNINAVGPLLVAQGVVDLLRNGRQARIVNISSDSGSLSATNTYRGYYYFGSKAALNMYTRVLAWDPETEGVIVAAVHPGWIRTDMGGPDADLSPQESAEGIIRASDSWTMNDNGQFYTWTGEPHPW